MVVPNSAEPMAAAADPNARQVRILKFVVIFLGILLLAAFAAVIGRIGYLAMRSDGGSVIVRQPQTVNLGLPAGAVIRQTTVSGDRLTIQFESPQRSGLVIVNLTTGQLVSRIEFQPEVPRQ